MATIGHYSIKVRQPRNSEFEEVLSLNSGGITRFLGNGKILTGSGGEFTTWDYKRAVSQAFNGRFFQLKNGDIAISSYDKTDILDSNSQVKLTLNDGSLDQLKILEDGNIVTDDYDYYGRVKIWNFQGREIAKLNTPRGLVNRENLVLLDGNNLAVSEGGDIKFFNSEGQPIQSLKHGGIDIDRLELLPNGNLVSTSEDKTIIWDLDLDNLIKKGCGLLRPYLDNPDAGLAPEQLNVCKPRK